MGKSEGRPTIEYLITTEGMEITHISPREGAVIPHRRRLKRDIVEVGVRVG